MSYEWGKSGWRYGKGVDWWKKYRSSSTDYRAIKSPPFYSSVAEETYSNALARLRRSMERLGLFKPSEKRLTINNQAPNREDRYLLTDRGRELAKSYEGDLKQHRVGCSTLKRWGLFPDKIGKGEYDNRDAQLKKLAAALPFNQGGAFDDKNFHHTWETLDELFRVKKDPLFQGPDTSGPLAALFRRLTGPHGEEEDIWKALRPPPKKARDIWDERLGLALKALKVLCDGEQSLFAIIGKFFVDEMNEAFPPGSLDCNDFKSRLGNGPKAQSQYSSLRREFLKAADALGQCEKDHEDDMSFCPVVEGEENEGYKTFRCWLKKTKDLTLDAVVHLHLSLPRFERGGPLPLLEYEEGDEEARFDRTFPWSDIDSESGKDEERREASGSDDDRSTGGDQRHLRVHYQGRMETARDIILGWEWE